MRARQLALVLLAGAALAYAPAHAGTGDMVALLDALVRQGDETPQEAIDSINELSSKDAASTPLLRRAAITGVGIVQARNGQNS